MCVCVGEVHIAHCSATLYRRRGREREKGGGTLVGAGRGKIARRCRRYKSPRFHPARCMSGMHLTVVGSTYPWCDHGAVIVRVLAAFSGPALYERGGSGIIKESR